MADKDLRRLKALQSKAKISGIVIRKSPGLTRKYDMQARLNAVMFPYRICTKDPYRGFYREYSKHRTLEEVERQLVMLGVVSE